MIANKEIEFWMTNRKWYKINKELDRFEINEDAPEQAKQSFEKWKKFNGLEY
jgi:hypothetical protein